MKKLLALLLTLLLALPSGFALAEETPAETNDGPDVLIDSPDDLAGLISGLLDEAQEKASAIVGEVKDKTGEIMGKASDKIDEIIEDVSKKAEESLGSIPEKFQHVVNDALGAPDNGKEKASELVSGAIDALHGAWETVKETAGEKASAVKGFVQDKVNQLLDLIKGNEPEPDPSSVENLPDNTSDRVFYFDFFYFGMPVSEAKTLMLADPTVDEENAVQSWVLSYDEPQCFAIFLFSGLDDSAKLTEIVCMLYSDEDTITDLEEGIDIQTTEETVNAIYDEVESWFTDFQTVELGDHLALPRYTAFTNDEETISRAVLYLFEDGEGYNAATHYVATADCGINVLQYLYLDAAEAEALLAK